MDRHVDRFRLARDRIGASSGTVDRAAAIVVAQLGAQVAREAVVGLDDARLDQHLADRDVDLRDHLADFIQTRWRVHHEQLVRADVGQRAAALGQHRLLLVGEHLAQLLGGLVVQREGLGAQRLDLGDLLLRFQRQLFLGGQLFTRRDHHDVAVLAHVQTTRLHDDVQRLVPGHILQAQRELALHGVAGDDVQVGEVGNDLQQCTHVDVLEVQRQALAAVAGTAALREAVRIFLDGLHFHHELRVALVGAVLPQTLRLDDQAGVAILLDAADGLDGRAEVGDIQLTAQVVRQARTLEFDDQALALLTHIDACTIIRQVDDHAAFTILAAAEVDVLERMGMSNRTTGIRLAGLRHHGQLAATCGRRGLDTFLAIQRQDQVIALDLGLEAHRARHVQHDTGALATLHHVDALDVTTGQLDQAAADAVVGVLEVERQAVRIGQAEAGRHFRERHAHADAHLRGAALLGADDRFDGVADGPRRAGSDGAEPDKGCGNGGLEKAHGRYVPRSLVHGLGSSSRARVVSCSTQSPVASRTSSLMPISVSVIFTMRP